MKTTLLNNLDITKLNIKDLDLLLKILEELDTNKQEEVEVI